jgi:hypothetical protein
VKWKQNGRHVVTRGEGLHVVTRGEGRHVATCGEGRHVVIRSVGQDDLRRLAVFALDGESLQDSRSGTIVSQMMMVSASIFSFGLLTASFRAARSLSSRSMSTKTASRRSLSACHPFAGLPSMMLPSWKGLFAGCSFVNSST